MDKKQREKILAVCKSIERSHGEGAIYSLGSEKANNALGNIGIQMNDVGNKIKNYFAN